MGQTSTLVFFNKRKRESIVDTGIVSWQLFNINITTINSDICAPVLHISQAFYSGDWIFWTLRQLSYRGGIIKMQRNNGHRFEKYFFKQLRIIFTWNEIKYLKKKKKNIQKYSKNIKILSFKIYVHKLNIIVTKILIVFLIWKNNKLSSSICTYVDI